LTARQIHFCTKANFLIGQFSYFGYNGHGVQENLIMATLTFKNSRGELVDVPTVAATRVKNEFGQILEQATHTGAVAITRHDTTKAVLVSVAEFESLISARSRTLDVLSSEFDQLLAGMQTAKSRKGMKAAFNASPAQLGRTAIKGARRKK
jgi:prevent-host-death family protein